MAKEIFTVGGVVIPYEGNLIIKKGVRMREAHVDVTGAVRGSETLDNSHTTIKVSVRNVGNLRDIMEQFYRSSFAEDGTGTLTASKYDPDNATGTLQNYDSGFLKDLPEQTDQDLTEYEFAFRPLII